MIKWLFIQLCAFLCAYLHTLLPLFSHAAEAYMLGWRVVDEEVVESKLYTVRKLAFSVVSSRMDPTLLSLSFPFRTRAKMVLYKFLTQEMPLLNRNSCF